MNSIPDMPSMLGADLGTNFDAALASVGPHASNTTAAIAPPAQAGAVVALLTVLAGQQTLIQLDQEASELGAELQSLETMLLLEGSTLTVDKVHAASKRKSFIAKRTQELEGEAAAVQAQITLTQITYLVNVGPP